MRKAFIFSPSNPYKSTPTAAAGGQDEFMSLLQGGRANTLVKDGVGVSQQRFLPFGGPRSWAAEDNTPWQNRGYTGHLHNDEVGLIYMNARYYVPSLGRFAVIPLYRPPFPFPHDIRHSPIKR